MSSSNRVRVAVIKESVYGTTPAAGSFDTLRFTSESLSGTPETTESQSIRSDRLSSGQVVTGLTVSGDVNFELAKEDAIDLMLESAMHNTWVADTPVAVDLTIAASAGTLTRGAGSFVSDGVVVGDFLQLTDFTNSANNVQVMVIDVVALVVTFVGPATIVDETGSGTSYNVLDKLSIGTSKISLSVEKSFGDLTNKAINYTGAIASNLNVTMNYGEIANGSVSFMANGYDPVDAAADFMTYTRTINAAATTNSLNGSVDMPFIASSLIGSLDEVTFCIQSVEISLNNNLTPQTCIGEVAPVDYSSGTAQIEISLSAYLADANWASLAKKLSQESFALGFMVKNVDGYYAFYLPAVQVSFDDPASAGQNQDIILDMSGTAKVGANGESSLTIYRS